MKQESESQDKTAIKYNQNKLVENQSKEKKVNQKDL